MFMMDKKTNYYFAQYLLKVNGFYEKKAVQSHMVAQGVLYTRTDFVSKEIAKGLSKTSFNTNRSEVAKIHCVI